MAARPGTLDEFTASPVADKELQSISRRFVTRFHGYRAEAAVTGAGCWMGLKCSASLKLPSIKS